MRWRVKRLEISFDCRTANCSHYRVQEGCGLGVKGSQRRDRGPSGEYERRGGPALATAEADGFSASMDALWAAAGADVDKAKDALKQAEEAKKALQQGEQTKAFVQQTRDGAFSGLANLLAQSNAGGVLQLETTVADKGNIGGKVIESAVYGRAKPMFGAPANAPQDASWPQPFPYTYDPDKAKALLSEAGLANGFETKLCFDASAATVDEPAALIIQDSLAKLGIKLTLEKVPDFFARRSQKNWPMAIDVFGAWFDGAYFFYRWLWHGQNTVFNVANYKNPEMDRLLDAARQERDGAAYESLAKQFIKLAITEVPYIPLYQPVLDVAVNADVNGYVYMFHRQVDARTLTKA